MQHDDHIRSGCQRLAIASLLVATVSVILVMNEVLQAQALSNLDGVIRAVVIHQYAGVHQLRQLADGDLQSFFRVVSGKDYRDALSIQHS